MQDTTQPLFILKDKLIADSMKGLELSIIVVLIIGIISLIVLLLFFTGPFQGMLTDTFCFFNNNVFKVFGMNLAEELCKTVGCKAERVVLEPLSKDQLVSWIAAYSISCWKEKSPACGNSSVCYELILKNMPEIEIGEEDLAIYMKDQGACHIIENNKIITEYGEKDFGGCGDEDLLIWQVRDYVIRDQKLILIQYDILNNRIVVKA